jgi:hypothetical protein
MARKLKSNNKKKKSTRGELKKAMGALSATLGSSIRVNSKTKPTSSQLSAAYLYALGCTISSEEIDYSLLDDCQTENIENENIDQSKEMSRITPAKSSTTDKFANTDDPFYELDDDLTERVKAVSANVSFEAESLPDLSGLVLVMANMG